MMHQQKNKLFCAGSALLLLLSLAGIPVSAEETERETFTEDKLTYQFVDGGVQVVSADQTVTKVTVPDAVRGEKVVSIGEGAFQQCEKLTQVKLPDTLTEIQNGAFYYCFALESVDIPDSVTEIGSFAFSNCWALRNVTLPQDLTVLADHVFYYDIGLEEVTLPPHLEELGALALANCISLHTVHVPESLRTIQDGAFISCASLKSFDIAEGNGSYATDENGILFSADFSKLVLYPAGIKDDTYTVPDGTAEIAGSAFAGALSLKEVTLPDSVTAIGSGAFADCAALTTLLYPPKVPDIQAGMFLHCSSLSQFIIPSSVISIETNAFYGCSALTEITIPESVRQIGAWAFFDCTGLKTVHVPDSVKSIGEEAFGYRTNENAKDKNTARIRQEGFVLSGSAKSTAKQYAEQYSVLFRMTGLNPEVTAWAVVFGIFAVMIVILVLMIRHSKKNPPKPHDDEPVSDPDYTSILAGEDDSTAASDAESADSQSGNQDSDAE